MINIKKIAQRVVDRVFKEQLLSSLMEPIQAVYPKVRANITKFWQTEPKEDVGGTHLYMDFEFELPKNIDDVDDGIEENKFDIKDKLQNFFDEFIYSNPDGGFATVNFTVKEKMDTWKIKATYEEGVNKD